jgi:hypothetical protein
MESQLLASLKKVTLLQSSWTSVADLLPFEAKGCQKKNCPKYHSQPFTSNLSEWCRFQQLHHTTSDSLLYQITIKSGSSFLFFQTFPTLK